jgi:hypothetical protein
MVHFRTNCIDFEFKSAFKTSFLSIQIQCTTRLSAPRIAPCLLQTRLWPETVDPFYILAPNLLLSCAGLFWTMPERSDQHCTCSAFPVTGIDLYSSWTQIRMMSWVLAFSHHMPWEEREIARTTEEIGERGIRACCLLDINHRWCTLFMMTTLCNSINMFSVYFIVTYRMWQRNLMVFEITQTKLIVLLMFLNRIK